MKFSFRSLLRLLLLWAAADATDTMPMNTTTPVCGDNEELFQLQMMVEEYGQGTYRVFTESTNETHDECINCFNQTPGADVKLCLPRDGCHTALVGRRKRYISCRRSRGGEELLVTWGDQTLRRNNAWFFDRIDFGNGCKADPVCDADNEILFEFFLERESNILDIFSYNLTEMAADKQEFVHLEGQAQHRESPFRYETACVPRISCLKFNMWYPRYVESRFYDSSAYSIRLDGVVYSENQLKMGTYGNHKLNKIIKLGNCSVETVCNATAEDLFAMDFEVSAAPYNYCEYNSLYESSSAIDTADFIFKLSKESEINYENYYVWGSDYEGFEVNKTYSFMTCIPNDECAKFSFATDNSVTYYKISQNGAELTQRVVHTSKDDFEKGLTTTNAGVCVSGTLSLVPGGVVASALAVLALLVMSL